MKLTPTQSTTLFTAPKSARRTRIDHYLYLVRVSQDCGSANNLVQDYIVHYADPAMRVSMLSILNFNRTDNLRQAEELAHFTQSTEIGLRDRVGRDVVSNVKAGKPDARKCYKCGKAGHLKSACPDTKRGFVKSGDAEFVLALQGTRTEKGLWVLDSGSSRHLVNDVDLLKYAEDCVTECVTADGGHCILRSVVLY